MKKSLLIIFIGTQLLLVCVYIDKQSRFVKLTYEKQTYERKIKVLLDEERKLINHLHALQNQGKIALFAQEKLGMKPLFLKNIKHLPQTETATHECHKQS